jgi:hypothetical protein
MNAGGPPPYLAQPGDPARDRDTVIGLWRGNLGEHERMVAKYDWFYLQCPYGQPLLQLLYHQPSGGWVGTCSMGRRRMLWRGREIRAGLLVDLAVLPRHRSLGPALMMQMGLIETARTQLDLTLGFPNPKAASVFRRIRYEHFADMVRRVRVLRYGHYLRRRTAGWLARPAGAVLDLATRLRDGWRARGGRRLHVVWSDQADPRMDTLWAESTHGDGLVAVRDAEFVRWRFDRSPLESTRHLLLSDPKDGRLCAWFTTAATAEGMLQVRDFWSLDAGRGIDPNHVDHLLRAAREAGYVAVSVAMATSSAPRLAAWLSRGFVERDRRPVYGYWSAPPNQPPKDIDLHLTCADEDE